MLPRIIKMKDKLKNNRVAVLLREFALNHMYFGFGFKIDMR